MYGRRIDRYPKSTIYHSGPGLPKRPRLSYQVADLRRCAARRVIGSSRHKERVHGSLKINGGPPPAATVEVRLPFLGGIIVQPYSPHDGSFTLRGPFREGDNVRIEVFVPLYGRTFSFHQRIEEGFTISLTSRIEDQDTSKAV